MAVIPSGGGGGAGGGSGWIRITDITVPGGSAINKLYQDPPGNSVLQSVTVSAVAVQVAVKASFPLVDVGGVAATLAPAADGGHYAGNVAVTLPGSGVLEATVTTPNGEVGATDSCTVTVDQPPEILTLQFTGGYPGTQTELKAGDTFQITGTTDKDADAIEVLDHGACVNGLEVIAVGQSFTITGTIADRGFVTQYLPARVRARDAVTGALGPTRDTNHDGGNVDGQDVVGLNNTYPTVAWGAITYPATQGALKGSEQATAALSAANLDTIAFDSPGAQLSIQNASLVEPSKTVTRIGGTYNITTPNLRATANRAANDATTVAQTVVKIAAVAASLQASTPAARLRSGGNDGTAAQNHTITVQSDQQLQTFSMDADAGGGTFLGSWAGGPTTFTRSLQVHDDDAKGSYAWQNVSATNLAGIVTNALASGGGYVLGGFVARSLTFAAFATQTSMNVSVVDFSKLQAGVFTATNQPALKQPIGTPPSVTNGYTIDATGVKPTQVIWLDSAAAASNSGGTAQITNVQEVA